MKTYILKVWYPTLPKGFVVGSKVKYYEGSERYSDSHLALESTVELTPEEVEDNPDFWEKVEDYKIKKLKLPNQKGTAVPDNQIPQLYNLGGSRVYTLKQLLDLNYEIVEVKRISDGEVFRIGDITKRKESIKSYPIPIIKMSFYNGVLMIMGRCYDGKLYKRNTETGYSARVEDIEHYRDTSAENISLDLLKKLWYDLYSTNFEGEKLYQELLKHA